MVWKPVPGLAGDDVGWKSRVVWGNTAERQEMLFVSQN